MEIPVSQFVPIGSRHWALLGRAWLHLLHPLTRDWYPLMRYLLICRLNSPSSPSRSSDRCPSPFGILVAGQSMPVVSWRAQHWIQPSPVLSRDRTSPLKQLARFPQHSPGSVDLRSEDTKLAPAQERESCPCISASDTAFCRPVLQEQGCVLRHQQADWLIRTVIPPVLQWESRSELVCRDPPCLSDGSADVTGIQTRNKV